MFSEYWIQQFRCPSVLSDPLACIHGAIHTGPKMIERPPLLVCLGMFSLFVYIMTLLLKL